MKSSVVLCVVLFVLTFLPFAQSQTISNANFDGSFSGSGNSVVATGWSSWKLNGGSSVVWAKESGEWWVHNGTGNAQRVWDGSAYDAGIMQQISGVNSGTTYEFKAWMHAYRADYGTTSFYVGINPTQLSPIGVTWSSPTDAGSAYVQVAVSEAAQSSSLTVLCRAEAKMPVYGERSSFFDDTSISVGVSQPTKTPTPQAPTATNTPVRTNTPTQSTCVRGDVNCRDGVTPGDALLAFNIFLGVNVSGEIPAGCNIGNCAADWDRNGSVTPGDALCIFSAFLGQSC